jgi:hypothetical protein
VSDMTYAIIESGVVVNAVLAEPDYAASQGWIELPAGAGIGWAYDGEAFTPPVIPPKPPEEVQAEIVAATQTRLDDFARTRGYDSCLSCCTYATSPTPRFAAEGQYCVAARDATWARLYEMLDEVLAGTRPMPSGYADIEAELPVLAWPN